MRTMGRKVPKHLKPLYVKVQSKGRPFDKVLVDNGVVVNILPTWIMRKLGKSEEHLTPTDVIVGNFTCNFSPTKGVISIQLQVGNRVTNTTFFVVDTRLNYNMLIGIDWIHINSCIPSSLHQALIILNGKTKDIKKELEITWADDNPFKVDTNNVEVDLYIGDLKALEFEDDEVTDGEVGVTPSVFLKYFQGGLRHMSYEFEKSNIISKDKAIIPEVK